MRYSLRTLFATITLIAIGLAIWFGYRRAGMCEVRWLKIDSAESDRWLPPTQIEEGNGNSGFFYFSQHRDARELVIAAKRKTDAMFLDMANPGFTLVNCDDAQTAENTLTLLKSLDQPLPGAFVIRGVVVDRRLKRVKFAKLELHGPSEPKDLYTAWGDGRFTMPFYGRTEVKPGSGYFLRVTSRDDATKQKLHWDTPEFTLSPDQPELEAVITVPWTMPEAD